MPTEKIYNKIIHISKAISDLGLSQWQTNFIMTDKKKGFKTDVKVNIKCNMNKSLAHRYNGNK